MLSYFSLKKSFIVFILNGFKRTSQCDVSGNRGVTNPLDRHNNPTTTINIATTATHRTTKSTSNHHHPIGPPPLSAKKKSEKENSNEKERNWSQSWACKMENEKSHLSKLHFHEEERARVAEMVSCSIMADDELQRHLQKI